MSCLNPPPSSPRRFVRGTLTLSKNNSEVSCAFRPVFSRFLPQLNPFRSVSTRTRLIPAALFSGSVFATTITRSALCPFVINVFFPLISNSFPAVSAVVFMFCRSLPVPGSVIAIAVITSPETIRGSQCFFWSSDP